MGWNCAGSWRVIPPGGPKNTFWDWICGRDAGAWFRAIAEGKEREADECEQESAAGAAKKRSLGEVMEFLGRF